MKNSGLRSRDDVLEDFARKGISVRSWALKHDLTSSVVHGVLKGKRTARIGKSHEAAVLLGIKDGEIVKRNSDGNS